MFKYFLGFIMVLGFVPGGFTEDIKLPEPEKKGVYFFEEVVTKRRSRRDYSGEPLKLEEVSQVLWAAQGITDKRGFRAVPSAGALYPLEVYMVVGNVENLESGIYHYKPEKHLLIKNISGDKRLDLCGAAFSQASIKNAPISIIVCAVYARVTQKYSSRGQRYVHMEAGHAGQNIFLQAESLGLGTVPIGAFSDSEVKKILNLSEEQEPLYIFPVGRP